MIRYSEENISAHLFALVNAKWVYSEKGRLGWADLSEKRTKQSEKYYLQLCVTSTYIYTPPSPHSNAQVNILLKHPLQVECWLLKLSQLLK